MINAATPRVTPRIEKTVINERPCFDREANSCRQAVHCKNFRFEAMCLKPVLDRAVSLGCEGDSMLEARLSR